MSNKCPECGLENRSNANFCDSCGHAFGENQDDNESLSFALPEGTVLNDRFVINKLIKVGGMGAVYKAEDKTAGMPCAVKELWTFWAGSSKEREYLVTKFQAEGQLLSDLDFIRLPKLVDSFVNNDRYYLVMEFIDGQDLDNIMEMYGSPGLHYQQVLNWGIQICEVLEYLHSQDPPVVYRDLKPSNLMVRSSDNSIVLIDFGIACTIREGSGGSPRTMIGTMGYMPPEQFLGKVDITSDIFSLGATLYYLLTGTIQVLFGYKPMYSIVPDISEKLDDVVRRALEFKPEDRFQSALEMKMDIERALKPDFLTTRRLSEVDLWIGHLHTGPDKKARLDAITMLEKFSAPKVTSALMDVLATEPDVAIREACADSLGKRKDPVCIPALIECTRDRSPGIVRAAMKSLIQFEDVRVLPCLITCLRDRDGDVRKNAAIALEELGDIRALDSLVSARSKEGIFSIGLKRVLARAIETLEDIKEQARLLPEEEVLSQRDRQGADYVDDISDLTPPPPPFEPREFKYEIKDKIYLKLLDEMLQKDLNSAVSVILMNKDKLDQRFFQVMDHKFEVYMEKDRKTADDISYLMKVMDNLRIREMMSPPYEPQPGEIEELADAFLEIFIEQPELCTHDSGEFPLDSEAMLKSNGIYKLLDEKEEESDIHKRVKVYKDILLDNHDTVDEVIAYYKELKNSYPEYKFLSWDLAWALMKKGHVENALKELVKSMVDDLSNNDRFIQRLLDGYKCATRQLTEEEKRELAGNIKETAETTREELVGVEESSIGDQDIPGDDDFEDDDFEDDDFEDDDFEDDDFEDDGLDIQLTSVNTDRLYIDLIEDLLSKDYSYVIRVIQSEREKFDKRFFEIFDEKMRVTLEHNMNLADDLSYLNHSIDNLKLREELPPLYVPTFEEVLYLEEIAETVEKEVGDKKEELKEEVLEEDISVWDEEDEEGVEEFDVIRDNITSVNTDRLYFDLIEDLLNKDYSYIIRVIQTDREKFDKRFFDIFDEKMKDAMEHDMNLANDLSYLNRSIDNLKLREKLPPLYVPTFEEVLYLEEVAEEAAKELRDIKETVPEEIEEEKVEVASEEIEEEKAETVPEEIEKEKVETVSEEIEKEKVETVPEEIEEEKAAETVPEEIEEEKVEVASEEIEEEKAEAASEEIEKEKVEEVPEEIEEEEKEKAEAASEEIEEEKVEEVPEEIEEEKAEAASEEIEKEKVEEVPEEIEEEEKEKAEAASEEIEKEKVEEVPEEIEEEKAEAASEEIEEEKVEEVPEEIEEEKAEAASEEIEEEKVEEVPEEIEEEKAEAASEEIEKEKVEEVPEEIEEEEKEKAEAASEEIEKEKVEEVPEEIEEEKAEAASEEIEEEKVEEVPEEIEEEKAEAASEEIEEEKVEEVPEEIEEEEKEKAEEVSEEIEEEKAEAASEEIEEEKVEEVPEEIEEEEKEKAEEVSEEIEEEKAEEIVHEEIEKEKVEETVPEEIEEGDSARITDEITREIEEEIEDAIIEDAIIEEIDHSSVKELEYSASDEVYLSLIDELLSKDIAQLVTVILSNRVKLDKRFFEILDYKVDITARKEPKVSDDLAYINRVISNLRIRENLSPTYVVVSEETDMVEEIDSQTYHIPEKVKEKVSEELTEEKSSEELSEEKVSEELTEEKSSEELSEEKISEELTEEKSSEELSEEKVSEELTEEKSSEELSEEKVSEELTEEKSSEELSEEKVSEELTEEEVSEELTEEKDFKYRDTDAIYVDIIEDLLSKQGHSLFFGLQRNRKNLDQRFFMVFEWKKENSLKENPSLIHKFTYLSNVLSNLKLREDFVAKKEEEEEKAAKETQKVLEEIAQEDVLEDIGEMKEDSEEEKEEAERETREDTGEILKETEEETEEEEEVAEEKEEVAEETEEETEEKEEVAEETEEEIEEKEEVAEETEEEVEEIEEVAEETEEEIEEIEEVVEETEEEVEEIEEVVEETEEEVEEIEEVVEKIEEEVEEIEEVVEKIEEEVEEIEEVAEETEEEEIFEDREEVRAVGKKESQKSFAADSKINSVPEKKKSRRRKNKRTKKIIDEVEEKRKTRETHGEDDFAEGISEKKRGRRRRGRKARKTRDEGQKKAEIIEEHSYGEEIEILPEKKKKIRRRKSKEDKEKKDKIEEKTEAIESSQEDEEVKRGFHKKKKDRRKKSRKNKKTSKDEGEKKAEGYEISVEDVEIKRDVEKKKKSRRRKGKKGKKIEYETGERVEEKFSPQRSPETEDPGEEELSEGAGNGKKRGRIKRNKVPRCVISERSLNKIKEKLSSEKFKIISSMLNKTFFKPELADNLNKLKFTGEEISSVLHHTLKRKKKTSRLDDALVKEKKSRGKKIFSSRKASSKQAGKKK